MKEKPGSKASQLRKADRTLTALLKTPKSRTGLIAAVSVKGVISRRYVFGWLAAKRQDGTVTTLKSTGVVMYQVTQVTAEVPAEGVFPSWLEPRALPASMNRSVYIDGKFVKIVKQK